MISTSTWYKPQYVIHFSHCWDTWKYYWVIVNLYMCWVLYKHSLHMLVFIKIFIIWSRPMEVLFWSTFHSLRSCLIFPSDFFLFFFFFLFSLIFCSLSVTLKKITLPIIELCFACSNESLLILIFYHIYNLLDKHIASICHITASGRTPDDWHLSLP